MPKHTAFGRFALALSLVVAAFLGGSAYLCSAPAAAPSATAQPLQPTDRHRSIARKVSNILTEAHYSRMPLDDALSAKIFDLYIEALDGSRTYFLASDLAEFQKLRLKLDDAIKSGALEPAFRIFTRFQERNRNRLTYAMSLLAQEPDFTRDEWFVFDREHAPWVATAAQMDELW